MEMIVCNIDEFKDESKMTTMEDREITCWIECIFLFSITWSIGASSDNNGRAQMDLLVRELMEVCEGWFVCKE